MRIATLSILALLATTAAAQWEIQDSGTTADLRGIAAVNANVAWASGTNGTALKTEDGGKHWQTCTIPPGAKSLDFRGVQAFDAKTAIVMSSGPGDLSRLYKTTDGCATWRLVFTNPDKDGFWDAIQVMWDDPQKSASALILGDPVSEHFTLFNLLIPSNANASLVRLPNDDLCRKPSVQLQLPEQLEQCAPRLPRYAVPNPQPNEAMFAASNSALLFEPHVWFQPLNFVTGGPRGARFIQFRHDPCSGLGCESWVTVNLPLLAGNSAGAFSIAERVISKSADDWHGVVVGGDYLKPSANTATAAYSLDEGAHWTASATPPHGYRSAVAYDTSTKTWITVGPNGTDISTDDGRNWRALKPGPGEPADADQHWNALSLPFVVGPKGRIGILRAKPQ